MPTDHRAMLANIKRFDQLIAYLRDEMGWPISRDSFEDVDDLFYDFTADELGIDPKTAAKIQEIKRLRPLSSRQPWGIFFIKFEPKKLPVVALRRILGQVALKKRASANSAERTAWAADDLLFISNYGEGDGRQISFAHFSQSESRHDLPTLKVLGWNNLDTALHLDAVARELTKDLAWPSNEKEIDAWRKQWRSAFTLRHLETVDTSKQLSVRLAELARMIRDRIKAALAIETDRGPLTTLVKAFKASLIHDLDADRFADMYAQTIAYGLLSARIADPHKKTADDFAGHMRTNPFLRELMEAFLKVGGRRGKAGGSGIDFDELGVHEVVSLLDEAKMEAVVRDFGDRNPQEDPVIHFYESFLKEYDKKQKVRRGVFYTPRPVVSYIVRSVDQMLRTELGLADGLADTTSWGEITNRRKDLNVPEGVLPEQDFVQILDPATGTGTFLVEAIDLIHETLVAKWKSQGHSERKIEVLWNDYVPKHLLPRLHGYELLMAPYAIAHLKIGLKLHETGYRFSSDKRARIYLTNALEPAHDFSSSFQFAIPALAHEAHEVNEIKYKQRFTVIIGNPPYAGLSANLTDQARQLVSRFKFVDGVKVKERGALQLEKNLQDDYIKFLALAEDRLTEAGAGVCGMICNHGFIDNPTIRGVRWSLLNNFHHIMVLDLHGDVNRGDRAPDGSDDQNVFDIKDAGVAVFIGIKGRRDIATNNQLRKSDVWGSRVQKFDFLGSRNYSSHAWEVVTSEPELFLFRTLSPHASVEYHAWPKVTEVFPLYSIGMITARDSYVIDFTADPIVERAKAFRDSTLDDEPTCRELGIPIKKGWNITRARERIKRAKDLAALVRPVLYRPFDVRRVFYHESLIWGMAWPVMQHMMGGDNLALITSRMTKGEDFEHVLVSNTLSEVILLSSKTSNNAFAFPLHLRSESSSLNFGERPNLAPQFLALLADRLGLKRNQTTGLPAGLTPEEIFYYAYGSFYSPDYRSRYSEFLKIDFPRLPLTGDLKLFHALARLGCELVALHLLKSPQLDQPITEFVGDPYSEVERISWTKGTVWVDKALTTGFKGVREDVWNFHVGGYQVCEKWLKDRKGRMLSEDDITHYQKIVDALSETIRLMKEIDGVIERHGGWPRAFQAVETEAEAPKVISSLRRIVQPNPKERYVTCVPLVSLKAAAGAFGDPQHVVEDGFEWVAVETRHRLRPGMFVAQVVGKSMEPAIPDGAWCLFRSPVEGTRQGKTVLVQLRDAIDPESGERYTVKRYESEKAKDGDRWRHETITLKPTNPDFKPIVLASADEEQLQVVAELVEVLNGEPA